MFLNNILNILAILEKGNLVKTSLEFTYPTFYICCSKILLWKNENIRFFFKPMNKTFCVYIVTRNKFILNHNKSLQNLCKAPGIKTTTKTTTTTTTTTTKAKKQNKKTTTKNKQTKKQTNKTFRKMLKG